MLIDASNFQRYSIISVIIFEIALIIVLLSGIIYLSKRLKAHELLKNFGRFETQIRLQALKETNSEVDSLLTIADINR